MALLSPHYLPTISRTFRVYLASISEQEQLMALLAQLQSPSSSEGSGDDE